jgi:conjugal transfer pilin signal peptidase TrbI
MSKLVVRVGLKEKLNQKANEVWQGMLASLKRDKADILRSLKILSYVALGTLVLGYFLVLNKTPSLPYYVFARLPIWMSDQSVRQGDVIGFAFKGNHPKYAKGVSFGKRVYGVAGDYVWVKPFISRDGQLEQFVCMNQCDTELERVGIVKRKTSLGQDLHIGFTGYIPNGYVFVATPHSDSFDSRYAEFGRGGNLGSLIKISEITEKLYPIF